MAYFYSQLFSTVFWCCILSITLSPAIILVLTFNSFFSFFTLYNPVSERIFHFNNKGRIFCFRFVLFKPILVYILVTKVFITLRDEFSLFFRVEIRDNHIAELLESSFDICNIDIVPRTVNHVAFPFMLASTVNAAYCLNSIYIRYLFVKK